MSNLIPFSFEGSEVRVLERDGDPWWVLADVCVVLDIKQAASSARQLDEDEKGVATTHTLGGPQEVTIINESGLWSLVLTSRKAEAKRFKKWLTTEVIPTIRKTGRYSVSEQPTQSAPVPFDPSNFIKLALDAFPNLSPCAYQTLIATTGAAAFGREVLPLPIVKESFFSAEQVGKELGISANMVGRIANLHSLKTEDNGRMVMSKSKSSAKQVSTFEYNAAGVASVRAVLAGRD